MDSPFFSGISASRLVFPDSEHSAREAGLRYVHDDTPGYTRRRTGKGFVYFDTRGVRIHSQREIERIASLAIPPAWSSVWICPRANGHIQATGRDARGRKQYRYHIKWNNIRNQTKFGRLAVFGSLLPQIRSHTQRQLGLRGMPREKVLAVVVALLEKTLIRIGNAEYSQLNGSYGLTTLLNRHVHVEGSAIRFDFRGKSGKYHTIDVRDRRLAAIVKRCQELPGQELFGYLDESGNAVDIDSNDVNGFLHEITGEDITAKDFRTWGGTLYAMRALCSTGLCTTAEERKKAIIQAVKETAQHLGNTAAVCRKYYIHSSVLSAYEQGSLLQSLEAHRAHIEDEQAGLSKEEQILLRFLEAAPQSLH